MNPTNPWNAAKSLSIEVAPGIRSGFDIGFDAEVPEETRTKLRNFVRWVEDNFPVPVPLWVDFEYKHYLVSRERKRMGYLFCWAEFSAYPRFENISDIPVIHLPVRTEHSTIEEILFSFIQAITCYFIWLSGKCVPDSFPLPDDADAEEILQLYLKQNKASD